MLETYLHIIILDINIHEEAIDCVIKYLIDPSISNIFVLFNNMGIKDNIFNSIDSQIKNQFLDIITIIDLKIKIIIINIIIGGINIRNW